MLSQNLLPAMICCVMWKDPLAFPFLYFPRFFFSYERNKINLLEKRVEVKENPLNKNILTQTVTIHIGYRAWQPLFSKVKTPATYIEKNLYTQETSNIWNTSNICLKVVSILNPKCLFHFIFPFWVVTIHFQEKGLRRTFWEVYKKAMRWIGKFLNYFRCDWESHWRNVLSWRPILFLICQSQRTHPYVSIYLLGPPLDSKLHDSRDNICLGHYYILSA